MKLSILVTLLAALGLAGCNQGPSEELLKQIAASTKENAETSKKILAALEALKPDPAMISLLKSIDASSAKTASSIAAIQAAVPAKAPFAFPFVLEGHDPNAECAFLGYTQAHQYTNDPRSIVCK